MTVHCPVEGSWLTLVVSPMTLYCRHWLFHLWQRTVLLCIYRRRQCGFTWRRTMRRRTSPCWSWFANRDTSCPGRCRSFSKTCKFTGFLHQPTFLTKRDSVVLASLWGQGRGGGPRQRKGGFDTGATIRAEAELVRPVRWYEYYSVWGSNSCWKRGGGGRGLCADWVYLSFPDSSTTQWAARSALWRWNTELSRSKSRSFSSTSRRPRDLTPTTRCKRPTSRISTSRESELSSFKFSLVISVSLMFYTLGAAFLGWARQSQDGLMESRLHHRHRRSGPPGGPRKTPEGVSSQQCVCGGGVWHYIVTVITWWGKALGLYSCLHLQAERVENGGSVAGWTQVLPIPIPGRRDVTRHQGPIRWRAVQRRLCARCPGGCPSFSDEKKTHHGNFRHLWLTWSDTVIIGPLTSLALLLKCCLSLLSHPFYSALLVPILKWCPLSDLPVYLTV